MKKLQVSFWVLMAGLVMFGVAQVGMAASINVAASANGGAATQSSTGYGSPASNANDGNTDGDYSHRSISHTNYDYQAWWLDQFNAAYSINEIDVWNRTDCCADRINTFDVDLYNSGALVWSSTLNSITSGPEATFAVPGIVADSVKIQLDGTNYLQLAEVQAFTDSGPSPIPEPSSLILLGSGLLGVAGAIRRKLKA